MRRPIIATVLDAGAAVLFLIALRIIEYGGFIVYPAGIRVRFRSPDRVIMWLTLVLVLRLVAIRKEPPFGVPARFWRACLTRDRSDRFRTTPSPASARHFLLAAVGIAIAVGVLLHAQVADLHAVPDLGDPLFSIWRMSWVQHQVVRDPSHLFDANIFYPEPRTLTLSDPIILPALAAAPLGALGLHPVVTYNVLFLSAFWLSGVATYLLVARLTGSAAAAFVSGVMFASYSYRFEHYSHLELQMTQWIPLALLALHWLAVRPTYRYAMALAVLGVVQLYSSMYYGVLLLVYVGVIGIGLFVIYRPSVRRLVPALAVASCVAALLTVPLAGAFLGTQGTKPVRNAEEIDQFSAAPADYLRTNKQSAIWSHRLLPPLVERGLFPGVVPVALGLIGLAPPLSPERIAYAVALLVVYDASLGFRGHVYPLLYRVLFPLRGMRAPARVSVFVGLTLCVFAGFGVRRIISACPAPRARIAVIAVLAAATLADAWPSLQLVDVWRRPPDVYEYLPAAGTVVLAEFPVTSNPDLNTPFLYFSTSHWAPMVNGYSGIFPLRYVKLMPTLLAFPRGDTLDVLAAHGVTHVTINCGLHYPNCEETRTRMRDSPGLRLVRESLWEGQPVELYELVVDRSA
jgi:hypothetical protein